MSTLALTLHEPAAQRMREAWNVLEAAAGVRGIRKVPFPHVTLFGCEGISHADQELAFEVRNLTICDWVGPRYEPRERYPLLGRAEEELEQAQPQGS